MNCGRHHCPVFNQAIYQATYLGSATSTPKDFYLGRPMSNHTGGFNAAFCDGSVRFVSEDMPYRIYCLLMGPNNQGGFNPSTATQLQYPGIQHDAAERMVSADRSGHRS